MADAIDQTTNAVGTAEEVDTSELEDTNLDDITWEDGDEVEVTEESDDDSAATDETDDAEEESEDDVADEATDEEAEDANVEDKTESDKEVQEAADKQHRNDEAAQRRIAEKKAREQAKTEALQSTLEQAYTNAYNQATEVGFTEEQARMQAESALAAQQVRNDAYQNRVMQVTNKVEADLNQAVSQIAEFKSDNPVIRNAMLRAVDNFEALHVQKDANGDAVQVTGDIVTFLQNEAEAIRQLTGLGAQQQEQAKSTQKKRTMAPPSRTPKKAKVDPDLAGFDEAIAQWS